MMDTVDAASQVDRAELFPSYWAISTFDHLGEWLGGGTPSKSNSTFWTGGAVPWVSPKDMKRKFIDSSMDTITEVAVAESAAKFIPVNSILVVTRSGILERILPVAINTVRVTVNQDIKALVPFTGIEPLFIFYYLKSQDQKIRELCAKTGTTVASVDLPRLREYPVGIPPKAEQARIVSAIESLQERSSRTRALLEEVKPLIAQLRQSVLRSAFSGRLTADWRAKQNTSDLKGKEEGPGTSTDAKAGATSKPTAQKADNTGSSPQSTETKFETATELLQRIRTERRKSWEIAQLAAFEVKGKKPTRGWQGKYKEPEPVDEADLPELPETWCWASFEELSWFVTDGDHNPPKRVPNGVPHLTAKNIKQGKLLFDGCTFITEESFEIVKKRYDPRENDVIITCVGTLGETAIVPEGAIFSADRNLAVIRLVEGGMTPQTAVHLLNGPRMQKLIHSASGSTAQPHLYLGDLRSLAVPLVPQTEQLELNQLLNEYFTRLKEVETAIRSQEQSLTQLDQSILSKAFRGELVPQDPNDEPASELLARIRATREATTAKKKNSSKKKFSKKKAASKRKTGNMKSKHKG